jgi:hypothetical protein
MTTELSNSLQGAGTIASADVDDFIREPVSKTRSQAVRELLQQVALGRSQFARSAGVTNHGIYEQRLSAAAGPVKNFEYIPHCMYFYYVRIDASGKLKIAHYFYVLGDVTDPTTWNAIPYDQPTLEGIVKTLAKNARRKIPTAPPPLPEINFKDIIWDRKGYIAIFVDEANWSFHDSDDIEPAVIFNAVNGSVENHAFFDAMNLRIQMPVRHPPGTDTRSAIVFVNHMKSDEDGTDLGYGLPAGQYAREKFEFEMFLGVTFTGGSDAPMTVIFDPGGTNQGPPLEP